MICSLSDSGKCTTAPGTQVWDRCAAAVMSQSDGNAELRQRGFSRCLVQSDRRQGRVQIPAPLVEAASEVRARKLGATVCYIARQECRIPLFTRSGYMSVCESVRFEGTTQHMEVVARLGMPRSSAAAAMRIEPTRRQAARSIGLRVFYLLSSRDTGTRLRCGGRKADLVCRKDSGCSCKP